MGRDATPGRSAALAAGFAQFYLTPIVLIGGLVVLGVLVGVGLVLLTVTRERRDARGG